jgi:hypothetical protein
VETGSRKETPQDKNPAGKIFHITGKFSSVAANQSVAVATSPQRHRQTPHTVIPPPLAPVHSDPGWVDQVPKATNGEGVDQVSGSVANQNMKATKQKAAASMSAGSAAPMAISTLICTPRAASTISA